MKTLKIILLIGFLCGLADAGERLDELKEKMSEAKEKISETRNNVKEKWDENERYCKICGKKIHGRDICAECLSKQTSEKARQIGSAVKEDWQKAKPKINATKEALGKGYSNLTKNSRELVKYIQDPETRENFVRAVDTVKKFKEDIEQYKNDVRFATYTGLTKILEIPVGEGTLLEEITSKFDEKFPGIRENLGISEAGPETIAAAVCFDREFLVNEVKIVKNKKGERVSIAQAVDEALPFSDEDAYNAFKLMLAAEEMRNSFEAGEVDVKSISEFSKAVKNCQKGGGK